MEGDYNGGGGPRRIRVEGALWALIFHGLTVLSRERSARASFRCPVM